jgi:hypothetical protein
MHYLNSYSEKKTRERENRKEEVTLFLFEYDMILYLTDPKNATTRLLDLILK